MSLAGIKRMLLPVLLLPVICLGQLPGEKYLSSNMHPIRSCDSPDQLAFLNSSLPGFRFFLSGETHGVSSNTCLRLMWLKHLYHTANVRNYLIEYPYSKSYLYNIYLETGNDSLLAERLQEERDFWKRLYEFNRTLPDTGKIRVTGTDFEVDRGRLVFFRKAIARMLQGRKVPEPITTYVGLLLSLDSKTPAAKARRYMRYCLKDMEENDIFYREMLGSSYRSFRLMLEAPQKYRKGRDKAMYAHFIKVMQTGRKGNWFGQFGNSHVQKGEKYTFAYLLNTSENSPFKNSVFTAGSDYKDCYSFYGKEKPVSPCYISHYEGKKELQLFLEKCSSDISLFNLQGEDNPFKKLGRSYDCILLIRNQPAQKSPDRTVLTIP